MIEAEAATPEDAPRTGWSRTRLIAFVAVTLIAALLRFCNLGDPDELVFDETYYAKDACYYVDASNDECETDIEVTQVHPPLGKWLIAAGIKAFGYDSFGWRISAAIAGAVTVALLFLLALKLLRSTLGATFASGLLALDLLHFVQSRTSMLDIFVPLFGVAAVLFLTLDRDRLLAAGADGDPPRRGRWNRPWRLGAGVCAGAAAASKWSGLFIVLLVILLTAAWEVAARRRGEGGRPVAGFIREELPTVLIYLVVVPAAVYTLSYIAKMDGPLLAAPWSEGSWLHNLWARQKYMLGFHKDLTSTHSYQSPAWSWLLLKRPVSYFFCAGDQCTPSAPDGIYQEIFASGSPFVWWTSVLALLHAAYSWIRRRDFSAPEGTILAGFIISYVPWLLPPLSNRPAVFIFYLLPAVPFMCLALALVATRLGNSWEAKASIGLFAATTVGLFAFYFPLLTKRPLPQSDWDRRIWVFDNCEAAPKRAVTSTVLITAGTSVSTSESVGSSNESLPPPGWCWI